LCVFLRVEAPVRFGNGLRAVGSKVVPEVLEVDALAPLHEGDRRWTVEVEMPQVLQEEKIGRVADARDEGVHQRKSIDLRRVLRSVCVRDHQSDVVSGDTRLGDAERLRQRMDVLRHRLLVVAGRRPG